MKKNQHQQVALKRTLMSLGVLGTLLTGPTAWAQAQSTAPAADKNADIEEVVVTGTRRADRTVLSSAVPIDVITAATFETMATTDTNSILKNLVPSFNVTRQGIADGSVFVRAPSMRGLPPDEVLTLVNGRRFHRSALVTVGLPGSIVAGAHAVDLAVIPTSAIERLEVLRDGASAQYGSDAIAGVMNFMLKRASSGTTFTARYGQYSKGDGEDTQYLFNKGFALGNNGFFNLSAEYLNVNETDRSAAQTPVSMAILKAQPQLEGKIPTPDRVTGNPDELSKKLFFNSAIKLDDKTEIYAFGNFVRSLKTSTFNRRHAYGATNPDYFNGANCGVGATAASCPEHVFTNGAYRTRTFGAASAFNKVYLDVLPGVTTPDGKPVYNINGATATLHALHEAGFTPRFRGDITDISIGTGLKGKWGDDITYDFFASYGKNKLKYSTVRNANASLGPYRDNATKELNQSSFDVGTLQQQEKNLNADFSYSWKSIFEAPILLTAGLERREERYQIGQGEEASWKIGPYAAQAVGTSRTDFTIKTQGIGTQGFTGYGPNVVQDIKRTNQSLYFGADADITKQFQLGAMLRFERFPADFGSIRTGKVSARYEFNPMLAVRGGYSTGFRAATPGQQGTYAISTGFANLNAPQTPTNQGTFPVASIAAKYFGAKPLQPERSKNFSLGVVLQPFERTTISLDTYQVDVRDRITISPNYRVTTTAAQGLNAVADRSVLPTGCNATNDVEALTCLGEPFANNLWDVNYFKNVFSTRTTGVDLVVTNSLKTDFGRWSTMLALNYNKTKVTKPDGTDLNGAATLNYERGLPKMKFNLTETWALGNFSTTAKLFWNGKRDEIPGSGSDPINNNRSFVPNVDPTKAPIAYNPIITYRPEYTIDLDVVYNYSDNLSFTVGSENLLNRYPEKLKSGALYPASGFSTSVGAIYPGNTTIPFNGRFLYAKVSYSF